MGGLEKKGWSGDVRCRSAREGHRATGVARAQDRRQERDTALPRRSACGREQRKGGERKKKQEAPPVREREREREPRGRVALLRRNVAKGFFAKDFCLTSFL
jgi:hypothetical protein